MNEQKNWQMPHAVQNQAMTANGDTHHFSAMSSADHGYPDPFAHSAPLHSSIPHAMVPPPNGYHAQREPEQESGLSSAPRPSSPSKPGPSHASFQSSPYLSAGRKRNRSDSLFPHETGPFFSSTKMYDNLFALDRATMLLLRIQSKMDRGFFLADNDWTCYRRNYFQVSVAFSIHGFSHMYPEQESQCLVRSEDGAFHHVRRFLVGISARVSSSDKKIELVQHTPKRDKGPQMVPVPKPITPGGNLAMSTVGTNQNIVTFERIQFKTATANNGKRRAAQQYYVCAVDLYAETEQGDQIKVASCQSAQLVVRGRSPGHYADSQEQGSNSPMSSATAPPPQPAPQPNAQPHLQQHPGGYDSRFHPGFARPPYTPPSMMAEYGSPYSYYPNYAPFGHPGQAPLPPPMTMVNAPHTPTGHQPHPPPPPSSQYTVLGNASPHESSPHAYGSEFHHQRQAMDEPRLHDPAHPSPNGRIGSHVPVDEWQRPPLQSPQQEHAGSYLVHGTPTLSSATSQNSPFSPTTPTTPYVAARKFNSVPNICNLPTSS